MNKDVFKYIAKHYPFEIVPETQTEGYLHVLLELLPIWRRETLKEQCSISWDFKSCLLYIPNDKIFISSFWKTAVLEEDIIGSLVYFTNNK